MRLVSLPPVPLGTVAHEPLQILLGTLGYERRALRIPAALGPQVERVVLADLDSPGQGSYDRNFAEARELGAELLDASAPSLRAWLVEAIRTLTEEHGEARVALDISSLTRDRIAYLIEGLTLIDTDELPAVVDVMYAPARPGNPPSGPELIEILGPVTPRYAGFDPDPNRPLTAFVGLGVEPDRAIGAIEYLEPGAVWAFLPFGEDELFDQAVQDANRLVWELVPEQQRISYRVDDPFALFGVLEALVFSERAEARPILVPLGPKIFTACCLLVASLHPNAGVWRVSPGRFGPHQDRDSAGKLIRLRLELGSRNGT